MFSANPSPQEKQQAVTDAGPRSDSDSKSKSKQGAGAGGVAGAVFTPCPAAMCKVPVRSMSAVGSKGCGHRSLGSQHGAASAFRWQAKCGYPGRDCKRTWRAVQMLDCVLTSHTDDQRTGFPFFRVKELIDIQINPQVVPWHQGFFFLSVSTIY